VAHPEFQYGAAVYGSVLVTALVGAMYEDHSDARTTTLSLVGSIVVFWLAHAWSEGVGERVSGSAVGRSRMREIAVAEWPLVEAGMLPALLLALAWAGLWSREAGAVLALAAAICQLVGWGALAGHRSRTSWPSALLVGAVDGLLGLVIVGLEIAVH